MKVLSIAAHPDDTEMANAGTLMKHKENNDEVELLVCTLGLGGECGDLAVRRKEARAAAHIIGINRLHILDYPVTQLNKMNNEFPRLLKRFVLGIKPDRIYTHSPFDAHQVHTTVCESVMKVTRHVRQILYFETISSTTPDFRPNAFTDISNYIDRKIKCVQAHKTQSHRFYLNPNILKSLANYRYVQGKVGSDPNGYAEAFAVHRMIV